MRVGAVFPQTEIGADPAVIRDYVQAVEGLGFDHLTAIDHVLGAGAPSGPPWAKFYTRERMFHEPLLLFAHLAAVTERIEFATAILILSQRQTALVAKQAAQLDVFCGGRTRLGIGIGWNAVEFEALNENFRDRGRRVEEQVEVLRRLWSEDLVTFEGRWHRLSDVGINPPPVQRPVPVWFGAFETVAIRRAARLGDGWIVNPRTPPGDEGRPRSRSSTGSRARRAATRRGSGSTRPCTPKAGTRSAGRRRPAPGRVRGRPTSPSEPSTAGSRAWMRISTRSAASGRRSEAPEQRRPAKVDGGRGSDGGRDDQGHGFGLGLDCGGDDTATATRRARRAFVGRQSC